MQWKTLQQQEERRRRALPESILQVGGNPKGGGRAGSGQKPEVKVKMGGGRPPRLGSDGVTFKTMRELVLPTRSTSSRSISQTKTEKTGNSRGGERW